MRPELTSNGAWWVLGLVLGVGLLLGKLPTGDALGMRRFLTPQASTEWILAQRFRMNTKGLSAIEIRAAAHGPVGGRYLLTLRDLDAPSVMRTEEIAATDLIRNESYAFRFPGIEDSARHLFQFEIAPVRAAPGHGVALWATKGERLDEGGLLINGQPRWASLAFQTHTSTVSLLRALLSARDPHRPPQWLALVGLSGVWIALRFVLKGVNAACDAPTGGAPGYSEQSGSDATGGVPAANLPSPDVLEVPPASVR